MSYKPMVQTTGKWCGNALVFETEAEALANARDLMMARWFTVLDCCAMPSDEPPNYRYVDGQLFPMKSYHPFNLNNTSGFTQADCDLLNQAAGVLMGRGIDESNACAIVNNNWQESDNTVESLTAR